MSSGPAPPLGAVLLGGRSRRMGEPKALLRWPPAAADARSLAAIAHAALAPHCELVVAVGAGPLPDDVRFAARVPDAPAPPPDDPRDPRPPGPLFALLGALDHAPDRTWLVSPCDRPLAIPAATAWLLAEAVAHPDAVAVLPCVTGDGPEARDSPRPLAGLYRPAAHAVLRRLTASASPRDRAPRRLVGRPDVAVVTVPARLVPAFADVDTPSEFAEAAATCV